MTLVAVDNLFVAFSTPDGTVRAVNGVSFAVEPRETLAIVGESGSGKTQLAFAMLGILARNGHATGSVRLDGTEILNRPEHELNRIRAEQISMIFQDPMTSLNPYLRIADQMAEVLQLHRGMGRRAAEAEAVRMLDAVRIPDARARLRMYPHEFSGGMRQRIMIAMSLLCQPRLLIADEPTTALDVTVQAQIMQLLQEIREEFGTAVILITHDLGIVAGSCDRTMVLYGGKVMETAPTEELFERPAHPYTLGLLRAVPRLDTPEGSLQPIPGEPPDMLRQPPGCPFTPRCPWAMEICGRTMPPLEVFAGAHARACHAAVEDVR